MEVGRERLELDVMITYELMILFVLCIARRFDCLLHGNCRPGDAPHCMEWSLTEHNIHPTTIRTLQMQTLVPVHMHKVSFDLIRRLFPFKGMRERKQSDC